MLEYVSKDQLEVGHISAEERRSAHIPSRKAKVWLLSVAFAGGISSVLLDASSAHAQCATYPYNLTNGSTADATQIMANFNCAPLRFSPQFTGIVSIGTTSPNNDTVLDVRSPLTVGAPVALFGYGQAGVAIEQDWPGIYYNNYWISGVNYFMGTGYAGILDFDSTNGDFFYESSAASGASGRPVAFNPIALYIKNNGYTGIGTGSPQQVLDIQSPNSPEAFFGNVCSNQPQFFGLAVGNNGKTDCFHYNVLSDGTNLFVNAPSSSGVVAFRVSNNDAVRISSAGYLGVGTTAPGWPLEVIGQAGGTTAWAQLSDGRLKTNVEPLSTGLGIIMQLRPVRYRWKASTDLPAARDLRLSQIGPEVGFIAQEVESILPEAVVKPKDENDFYALKEGALIPALVAAIKEQEGVIEALQKRVATLEGKR